MNCAGLPSPTAGDTVAMLTAGTTVIVNSAEQVAGSDDRAPGDPGVRLLHLGRDVRGGLAD